jgi:hypothetical protein
VLDEFAVPAITAGTTVITAQIFAAPKYGAGDR